MKRISCSITYRVLFSYQGSVGYSTALPGVEQRPCWLGRAAHPMLPDFINRNRAMITPGEVRL